MDRWTLFPLITPAMSLEDEREILRGEVEQLEKEREEIVEDIRRHNERIKEIDAELARNPRPPPRRREIPIP